MREYFQFLLYRWDVTRPSRSPQPCRSGDSMPSHGSAGWA